jgi:two-component system response regulator YesN
VALSVLVVLKDEKIRQQIAQSIDWIKMDLELVASLNDATIAQTLIQSLSIDIVISEIKIDGIYTLLELCPLYHTLIAIDEAEDEIKKAINFGIYKTIGYPLNVDSIIKEVEKIKNQIIIDKEKFKHTKEGEIYQSIKLCDYSSDLLVLSAISFIKQNYKRPIGLQEAASIIKVSEAHLSRVFKDETKMNYVRYLNIYRINATIELMRDEYLSIREIALSCGFNTMSYFAKVFKREIGISPSKYRKLYILY